jgi:hypothetical protein
MTLTDEKTQQARVDRAESRCGSFEGLSRQATGAYQLCADDRGALDCDDRS